MTLSEFARDVWLHDSGINAWTFDPERQRLVVSIDSAEPEQPATQHIKYVKNANLECVIEFAGVRQLVMNPQVCLDNIAEIKDFDVSPDNSGFRIGIILYDGAWVEVTGFAESVSFTPLGYTIGKCDEYLDKDGNPVGRIESHILHTKIHPKN